MEVTGLAVGVVGLAGLFSVCLDSLSRFQTYRDSNSETHVLDTRFRAARARFEQWGVSVGISDGRLQPDHHRGLDNKETANLIESILEIIAKTICDESILQRTRTGPILQSGQFRGLSQSRSKRLKWALGGKDSRLEQVDVFEKLVQQLYNLIQPEDKGQNFEGLESTAWVEDIRQMLTKIEDGIKSGVKRDVLSWLGESSPIDKYDDSVSQRVDTTCEWIFDRPTFKTWLSPVDPTKPSVLWINGPAGFGKTVLCAHIVHHLTESLDQPVTHFFFTSDHTSREDPFFALRSWQRQIAATNDDAFECILRVWENSSSGKASRKVLLELFKDLATTIPGCIFIADGLDECSQLSNGDVSVARFLRDVMGAITGTDVRLLLVSRDEPEIREALIEHRQILSEYKVSTKDVRADTAAFSQSVVNRKLGGKSEDIRLAISESMTDKCQGQFLWIKMQEQCLRSTMSKKRLHEVVENTPSGLDRLYDQTWSRIMNMPQWDRDRAFSLLRWTAFTFLPLTVYEVTEAIIITQFEELDLNEYPENIDEEYVRTEIVMICGPLLEVHGHMENSSPGDWTLRIPHFSVYQYLVEHLPAPAWMQINGTLPRKHEEIHHTAIARACIQYLSSPHVWEEDVYFDPCSKSFLGYAAYAWMRHAKSGFMEPSLLDLSKAFLLNDGVHFNSLVNYFATHQKTSLADIVYRLPQLRPFEYVFYGGWISMAEYLMDDSDVNEIGAHGRSPIFSACLSGSVESVHMLIEHGADLNITDSYGRTCLHIAAQYGYEDIVRILVKSKVYVSTRDHQGYTPMHFASVWGHIKCYQYLLERGADVNIKSQRGSSVVHTACLYAGRAELLKFILRDAPNDFATRQNYAYCSPLDLVSRSGDVDMAKVLFEHGAISSLFIPNKHGELPLLVAVSYGHVELVKLFLEHGGDRTLSIPSTNGVTALHFACSEEGYDDVIGLLLRPGVEQSLLMGIQEGNTPLHVASVAGHDSYVKLILRYLEPEHQCLLEIRNKKLQTPLHFAAFNGHSKISRTLLGYGADPNALDCHKISPLWVASSKGYSEVVDELLSHGAGKTITTPNKNGKTPLYSAAAGNHVEVVKILLGIPGISVNQQTTYGFTPLFIASRNGYHDVVELLLAADSIEKDSENWLGLTPLFAAIANGHLEVTKLLLSKGASVQSQVSIGQNLLWWGQRSNEPGLVQLLEAYEDITNASNWKNTPLPGPFTSLKPLSQNAETVACTPGMLCCHVCTLTVQKDQNFDCYECEDCYMFLCSECYSRGFRLCPRSHILVSCNRAGETVPLISEVSSSQFTAD
ncbi:hypothetical protein LB506_010823 [Fusarium annulatum]|nr:hypothetical protein LB506_010823 [Fusarium annulatum]